MVVPIHHPGKKLKKNKKEGPFKGGYPKSQELGHIWTEVKRIKNPGS